MLLLSLAPMPEVHLVEGQQQLKAASQIQWTHDQWSATSPSWRTKVFDEESALTQPTHTRS